MPSPIASQLRKTQGASWLALGLTLFAAAVLLRGLLSSEPVQALPADPAPMVLAVGYFDNRSEAAEWQALSKGLADMLITDLADTEGVTMVERDRLQAVLGEIKLGKSAFVDPASAAKLGKGLGASHILLGAYHVNGGKLRIDARAVEVAKGTVGATAQESGAADDVFAIEAKLADRAWAWRCSPVRASLSEWWRARRAARRSPRSSSSRTSGTPRRGGWVHHGPKPR